MRRLVPLMLALSACAGPAASGLRAAGDARPDWLDGPVLLYPSSRYVSGVGEGDDRTTAEDRARAKVAEVFQTDISATSSSSLTETAASRNGGPAQVGQRQAATQDVEASTRRTLTGVEIAEVWQSPQTRRFHALAVLDRRRAREALLSRLASIDALAAPQLSRLETASTRLGRAAAAGRLAALARDREPLLDDLRVVAPDERVRSPVDWPARQAAAEKALSELVVTVAIDGPAGEAVTTGVVEGLAALQLAAARPGAPDPDLAVSGSATLAEPEPDRRNGPWQEARASATVSLADGRTGQVFQRFDVSHRELSGQYQEAVRRALAGLGKKVAAGVKEALDARLAGE